MFPAGAGMNRDCANSGEFHFDVPRRRGDEPTGKINFPLRP